jgi:hypothetical protein
MMPTMCFSGWATQEADVGGEAAKMSFSAGCVLGMHSGSVTWKGAEVQWAEEKQAELRPKGSITDPIENLKWLSRGVPTS